MKIWTPLCNCIFAFFFDSRPLVIFSLLSTRAILRSSERLKQVSTYHENTPLSNIEIAGDKRSLQIILGQRYSINRISRFFKTVHILGMPVLYRLICMVYGREGPDVEFKVRLMSQ